jgi:hypothetical protein
VAPFYFPGSPFFLGAILILIGVYIAYLALRKGHHLVVPSVENVNRIQKDSFGESSVVS